MILARKAQSAVHLTTSFDTVCWQSLITNNSLCVVKQRSAHTVIDQEVASSIYSATFASSAFFFGYPLTPPWVKTEKTYADRIQQSP